MVKSGHSDPCGHKHIHTHTHSYAFQVHTAVMAPEGFSAIQLVLPELSVLAEYRGEAFHKSNSILTTGPIKVPAAEEPLCLYRMGRHIGAGEISTAASYWIK